MEKEQLLKSINTLESSNEEMMKKLYETKEAGSATYSKVYYNTVAHYLLNSLFWKATKNIETREKEIFELKLLKQDKADAVRKLRLELQVSSSESWFSKLF